MEAWLNVYPRRSLQLVQIDNGNEIYGNWMKSVWPGLWQLVFYTGWCERLSPIYCGCSLNIWSHLGSCFFSPECSLDQCWILWENKSCIWFSSTGSRQYTMQNGKDSHGIQNYNTGTDRINSLMRLTLNPMGWLVDLHWDEMPTLSSCQQAVRMHVLLNMFGWWSISYLFGYLHWSWVFLFACCIPINRGSSHSILIRIRFARTTCPSSPCSSEFRLIYSATVWNWFQAPQVSIPGQIFMSCTRTEVAESNVHKMTQARGLES